jgi:putative hemolysin
LSWEYTDQAAAYTCAVRDTTFSSVIPNLLPFRVPSRIEAVLEHTLGVNQLERVYATLRAMTDETPIAERLLQHLEITERTSQKDLERIPRQGPVLLVVNHPFGILEGAVLLTLLSRIRSDVKFLANGILKAIPEIRERLIPVDPLGGEGAARSNCVGLRKSVEFLAGGGVMVIFPAGEVSHFQWRERSITDPKWNPAIAKLLAIASRRARGISVIPVYMEGSNSLLFQAAGLVHPRLRTIMLGRELLNKKRASVEVRIGSPIAAEKLLAIPSDEKRTEYLRWRTYLLASRNEYKPRTALPFVKASARVSELTPIAPPADVVAMAREVEALPAGSRLANLGDLSAYLTRPHDIPAVLSEIGRLREVTFHAAGEGTGKPIDLDAFDPHYLHLFIWNESKREVAGAYRLVGTDAARSQFGIRGLYTATLFRYGNEFLERMGPALELGRSFVRIEYQKGFATLLLLWKGIGKYVAQNPQYKTLFGPVSISNQYHSVSRQLMVSFLERNASLKGWAGLVATRNPFRSHHTQPRALPNAAFDLDDLSAVVSDLEPSQAGVPVLLRQYLKLGGKLLGFSVDPRFGNTLDGLILVDLTKTDSKLLDRYLGKREAAQFRAFQAASRGVSQDRRSSTT